MLITCHLYPYLYSWLHAQSMRTPPTLPGAAAAPVARKPTHENTAAAAPSIPLITNTHKHSHQPQKQSSGEEKLQQQLAARKQK